MPSKTKAKPSVAEQIAQLTSQVAKRATNPVLPDRLVGFWPAKGPAKLKNRYGEIWTFDPPAASDMETAFGTSTIILEGDAKIPDDDLLNRLKVEAAEDPQYWSWDFNRDLPRPSESQAFAWYRPESANPKAPVFDIVLMCRYVLYVVSAFPKYGEDGTIIGFDLRGETEERARARIEAYIAKREAF
mgnify:CR=1 FL=1